MVERTGLSVTLRVHCRSCFCMTPRHITQHVVSFFHGPEALVLPPKESQGARSFLTERAKCLYGTRALLP